jgi:hypothetical protein
MIWLRAKWRALSGPAKVALVCTLVAVLLTVVGQLRHPQDITVRSMLMGILIGGGSWGLVSWAIAYAAWDVESDLAQDEAADAVPAPAVNETAVPGDQVAR